MERAVPLISEAPHVSIWLALRQKFSVVLLNILEHSWVSLKYNLAAFGTLNTHLPFDEERISAGFLDVLGVRMRGTGRRLESLCAKAGLGKHPCGQGAELHSL